MNAEKVFARVVAAIVEANRDVEPGAVRADASLTAELGMDSMRIAALASELKRQFGEVDMTDWYVSAAQRGGDTVGSLVDFLQGALAPGAAALGVEALWGRGQP